MVTVPKAMERQMTHALTLTLPLKQDPASQTKLAALAASFTDRVQPAIAAALKKSQLVHFARVDVIDNKYIQVITEYEGPHQEYTEFFRRELTPVFAAIFDLAEGAPEVKDANAFWEYAKVHNVRTLGTSTSGSTDFDGKPAGWLFSAYDGRDVKTILEALAKS
jgi:hypothetical protein